MGAFAVTASNSLIQDEQNRYNINEQQSCQPAVFPSTNQACSYAAKHQYENYPSCASGQCIKTFRIVHFKRNKMTYLTTQTVIH